jgi:glycosyltransferase involved in cell wall biosynthesis
LAKPRLLIVLNRLSIGGPATNTLAVAAALKDDFEILLVAGEPVHGEDSSAYLLDQYSGFRVQMLTSMKRAVLPLNDYHAYRQIRQIIKKFQPHIIHTHGSKPGVIARIAAWRLKVPVITHTYHGHVFHSYFSPFISACIIKSERWLAKKSTFIVAINERLKQELTVDYRIAPAEKIILNRLGIDMDRMRDEDGSKRQTFRNEFQLRQNEIAIGIIGRLVPVKQHHVFIEVVAALLNANLSQPLRFFIVGDGDEKPKLMQQLRSKSISYTLAHDFRADAPVVFTSWRKDMDAVMFGLDMVLLTSQNEGTPVSIMEAMTAGKPVVAPDVGGIAELFQDNTNGLLYTHPHSLFDYTSQLIHSPELCSKIGASARSFASSELNLQKQVNDLRKAYLRFTF